MKSFGRREAYESLRGTNPRSADNGLWVFLFWAERVAARIGGGRRGTGCDLSELSLDLMALPVGTISEMELRSVADEG